jgi:hypothetical protein
LARGAEEAFKLIYDEEETSLELAIRLYAPTLSLRGTVERPLNRVGGRFGAACGHPRPTLRVRLCAGGEFGQDVALIEVRRQRTQAIRSRLGQDGTPNVDRGHRTGPGEQRHQASPNERGLTRAAGADDEEGREPVLAHGRRQELVASLLDSKLAAEEDRAAVTV